MKSWIKCSKCKIKQTTTSINLHVSCCHICGGKIDLSISSNPPDWWNDPELQLTKMDIGNITSLGSIT